MTLKMAMEHFIHSFGKKQLVTLKAKLLSCHWKMLLVALLLLASDSSTLQFSIYVLW